MDNFLPKAFDLDVSNNYCCDYQFGRNKTSPHWHSGAEIIFVLKGNVDIMLNDSWHTLKKGAMIFIPPKQIHCCSCNDDNCEKIVLGFKEICLGAGGIGLSLPSDVLQFCVLHNLDFSPVSNLIKDFNKHTEANINYFDDLMAKSALLQIYAFLIDYWKGQGVDLEHSSHNKAISMIFKYIEEHYMDQLSPYEIAKRFNISYSGLAKAIQKYRHTTFIKCVNQIRVEHAKRLLALTDKSITEIGLECGFSVTSYFIKAFHQLTGMTPKSYRRLLK